MNPDAVLDALCDVLLQWSQVNGLPYLSADEYDFEKLTFEQRCWLWAYMRLWEITG